MTSISDFQLGGSFASQSYLAVSRDNFSFQEVRELVCYWHLASHQTSCNAQFRPLQQRFTPSKMSKMPRLRNPALEREDGVKKRRVNNIGL